MTVRTASGTIGANGDRAGHGRRKKSPMPRIEVKGEAKQEKKKEKDHFQSTYR